MYCPNQMLAEMVLSQVEFGQKKPSDLVLHVVPDVWGTLLKRGPRFVLRRRTLQFSEGTKPHLRMGEWNHPTPVRRRLSLTQAVRDKFIPTGLTPVLGMKTRNLKVFWQYSAFHLYLSPRFPLSCAPARPRSNEGTPAQYFRFAAHCVSFGKTCFRCMSVGKV